MACCCLWSGPSRSAAGVAAPLHIRLCPCHTITAVALSRRQYRRTTTANKRASLESERYGGGNIKGSSEKKGTTLLLLLLVLSLLADGQLNHHRRHLEQERAATKHQNDPSLIWLPAGGGCGCVCRRRVSPGGIQSCWGEVHTQILRVGLFTGFVWRKYLSVLDITGQTMWEAISFKLRVAGTYSHKLICMGIWFWDTMLVLPSHLMPKD